MNKVEELKAKLVVAEQIEAFRKKRAAEFQAKVDEILAKSELGKRLAEAQKEWREAVEHAFNLEQDLRVAAFTIHNETGNKKPAVGVEIQNTVAVEILDVDAAIKYSQAHAPKLIVTKPKNLSSFKSYFRRQFDTDDRVAKFIELRKGHKVVLKRKLWTEEKSAT